MSEPRRFAVVTGATGFLGRSLSSRLVQSGLTVRAAARTEASGPWSEFVRIDLPRAIPDRLFSGADVVFHLAGQAHALAKSREDAALYREVNTRGTEELAAGAARAGVRRFVFMSTVKALGEPGQAVVREDQESAATDPYGRSKREAEEALASMRSSELEVVVLRPVLVYGPGAKGNLDALLRFVQRGVIPPLPRIANRRSMVGVNDLIDATVIAGRHPAVVGRTYTVTDGAVYSTTQIIEILAAANGITRPARFVLPLGFLRVGARVGDVATRITGRQFPIDSDVVRRLLGNAEYEARRLSQDTGFVARQTLSDLAAAMVSGAQRSGLHASNKGDQSD